VTVCKIRGRGVYVTDVVFCNQSKPATFGFGDGGSSNAQRGMGRGMAKNG